MIRILHVDDASEDAELIQYNLKKLGQDMEIEWAVSAREALQRVRNESFDLILSDYQMPGMDGLQLLSSLREEGIRIPFIFLTGQGNETVAGKALQSGADDYYTKEAGFAHYDRLINSIRRVIDNHSETQQRLKFERAVTAILKGMGSAIGQTFFNSLVTSLSEALGVRYAFIGKFDENNINTLAFSDNSRIVDNVFYNLDNTPCRITVDRHFCFFGNNVQKLFPKDLGLIRLNVQSYCGACLLDSEGLVQGILVVMDVSPMTDEHFAHRVLDVFASRAAAELERTQAMIDLSEAETRYRHVFNAVDEPMFILEPETERIIDANAAFLRFCGSELEDVKGMMLEELCPSMALKWSEATANGYHWKERQSIRFQVSLSHRSAGRQPAEIYLKPLRHHGKTCMLGTIHFQD